LEYGIKAPTLPSDALREMEPLEDNTVYTLRKH